MCLYLDSGVSNGEFSVIAYYPAAGGDSTMSWDVVDDCTNMPGLLHYKHKRSQRTTFDWGAVISRGNGFFSCPTTVLLSWAVCPTDVAKGKGELSHFQTAYCRHLTLNEFRCRFDKSVPSSLSAVAQFRKKQELLKFENSEGPYT